MAYQYETTVIITPVLTDAKLKNKLKDLVKNLKSSGATIVDEESWGLRKLAYPIGKKTTGFYFTVEYVMENGESINTMELALKRDDDILRFLTIGLDKFSLDYNDRRRKGLVGRKRKKQETKVEEKTAGDKKETPKVAPKETSKDTAKETAKEKA